MSIRRLLICGGILALSAACGGELVDPDPLLELPASFDDDDDDDDDDDGDEQEVELEGSTFSVAGTGLRVLTVDAESEDGEVEGTYRVELTGPGLFFEVEVSCLVAEGSTAWIAGHVSDTNAGFVQLGSVSYFYAIDRGDDDDDDERDIVSVATLNINQGLYQVFCAERPLELPSAEVDGGDLEIEIDD